ncbi:MAG: tetratricopeptide repeat-containing protein [Spirochaetia bacterium]
MKEQNRDRFDAFLKRNRSRLGQVIHEMWDSRDQELWAKDPYYFLRLGERADTAGQAMFAHDVLKEGLRVFPGHLLITQRYCKSLINCGFLLTAKDLLARLMKDGHFDEETLGTLGRVYKEMWLIEGNGEPGHPHLGKSREVYLGAFRRHRRGWSGINAASLSLIMGDSELSRRVARQVLHICADLLKDPSRRDYWTLATVAEAFLLLGRQERAAKFYRLARARSPRNYGNLASSRRQLSLLARYVKVDPAVLDTLRIPPVVAFTGHMIDPPDQPRAHFPQSASVPVKQKIASVLRKLDARIGYASAACGADILFHECLLARGGESNVVLPFDKEDFFQTSVDFAGQAWKRRARAVLSKSSMVEQATRGGYREGNEILFSYANQLILGKAILRSRFLETEPLLMAVWDGERNGKPGGTSECVRQWEETGFPYVVIDPVTARVEHRGGGTLRGTAARGGTRQAAEAAFVRPASARDSARAPSGRTIAQRKGRQTIAILFADMVGYSKLREEQVPAYVRGFLTGVSKTLSASAVEPLYKNTWGDAICLAFDDPVGAAECAISLRDMVRRTDWSSFGLPPSLNVRIGLHAGPVYCVQEPLLERLNVFGFHVNQAARIEPITSPGNVYASESFAALLLADPRNRLDCRYVGVVVLPKNFGSYPIYHIKRRTEVG